MRFGPLPRMITFGTGPCRYFGLLVIRRVQVRRARRELSRAGIDRVVDGPDAERTAQLADHRLGHAAQLADLRVRKAEALGGQEHACSERVSPREPFGFLLDPSNLIKKPRVDSGRRTQPGHARPGPQCLMNGRQPAVVRRPAALKQLSGVSWRIRPGERRSGPLKRSQGLLESFWERPANRHRLPDRLHVRRQRRIGARELLEREPRHLDHHVVEAGLEAGRGLRR